MQVQQFGAQVTDPFGKAARLLCSFSCGAASAVATKLAIERNDGRLPVHIMYIDTRSEHPDNARFRAECEAWFGHPVHVHASSERHDIWDVFERDRYMSGINGARCTKVLKRWVADSVERVDDLQVIGYTAGSREQVRADRLWREQPEKMAWFPLIDAGITKADCFGILAAAGIKRPVMYDLGFDNNNCIGCVKGGNRYWSLIRKHFPSVFVRACLQSRALGVRLIQLTIDGVRSRYFLDELPPDADDETPVDMSCGFTCAEVAN